LLASLKRELSRETKLSKIVYKRMPKWLNRQVLLHVVKRDRTRYSKLRTSFPFGILVDCCKKL
jgi:hypothetical protein